MEVTGSSPVRSTKAIDFFGFMVLRAVFEMSWRVLARGSSGIRALEPPPRPQINVRRCSLEHVGFFRRVLFISAVSCPNIAPLSTGRLPGVECADVTVGALRVVVVPNLYTVRCLACVRSRP